MRYRPALHTLSWFSMRRLTLLAALTLLFGCDSDDAPADAGAEDVAEDVAADGTETTDAIADGSGDTAVAPADLLETYPLADELAYPEAVTFDAESRAFFTGSMVRGNVLRVDADGTESEFFPGNEDGEQWLVLGLEADSERRRLWTCAAFGTDLARSELWMLDLDSGERLWNHDMETTFPGAACTDVVVAEDGTAYICDREFGNIYVADAEAETVEVLTSHEVLDPGTIGGNGIALTSDGQFLLVVKFLPVALARISLADVTDVQLVELPELAQTSPDGGGDALVLLDDVGYIVTNGHAMRLTPEDDTWTTAHVEFQRPRADGALLTGMSGLTVAEGQLYASKSDVIRFALSLPPTLPFRIHQIDASGFDAP